MTGPDADAVLTIDAAVRLLVISSTPAVALTAPLAALGLNTPSPVALRPSGERTVTSWMRPSARSLADTVPSAAILRPPRRCRAARRCSGVGHQVINESTEAPVQASLFADLATAMQQGNSQSAAKSGKDKAERAA